jgi:hypothetical protein
MLETLRRHSAHPLPNAVVEAVKHWANRRERVTCYGSATLLEFGSLAERDRALALWPPAEGRTAPVVVSDRLILVEDEQAIPFHRFRLSGSRDYRQPPEACVVVDHDGVTMTLDQTRADLLIDAELLRFARELPTLPSSNGNPTDREPGASGRRFEVSSATLDRAFRQGLTMTQLTDWYQRRTGATIPASIRLLASARSRSIPPLSTARRLILNAPTAEILDGLLQHPGTRSLLDERLGPCAVVVPDERLPQLKQVLRELGVAIEIDA